MTTNKNRNMNTHFIKNLALVVAGLLMTISCSGNTGTKEKKVTEQKQERYLSRLYTTRLYFGAKI